MKSVVLNGTPERPIIDLREVDEPRDERGRLIVAVAAAGITRMEPTWITSWEDQQGKPRTQPVPLGLELAGRVASVGQDVDGFRVGQSVVGLIEAHRGGALSEFASVSAEQLLPMPNGLSSEDASVLPLAGVTAWQGLIRHGRLARGERVLIHGGAGGVGTFAIQIARMVGAYVVVTASSEQAALCRSLGADEVVDYKRDRFERTGIDYDLVFDQIGGDVQERSWAVVKRGGRLITIAGEQADGPDPRRAAQSGIEARFFVFENDLDTLRRLTSLVLAGTIRPIIGKRYDLSSTPQAFANHCKRVDGKAVVTTQKAGA